MDIDESYKCKVTIDNNYKVEVCEIGTVAMISKKVIGNVYKMSCM